MNRIQQHTLWLHLAFGAICLLTLLAPVGLSTGTKITLLVLGYNIALPLLARRLGHGLWFSLWRFLLPLSLLQILPDWFLSAQLGILNFPDTGALFIGTVPAFMGGMWVIPLFLIVFIASQVEDVSKNQNSARWAAALVSLAVFVGAEATLWAIPIWHAQNVTQIAGGALYLLIPEALLGLHAFLAYKTFGQAGWGLRLAAAFTVMSLYFGGITLFYFLVEKILPG